MEGKIVKRGMLPVWVKEILRKEDRPVKPRGIFEWYELLDNHNHSIIDHAYPFDVDGYFVSEPYELTNEDFQRLLDLSKKYGLRFIVTGESEHFPGRTLKVIVFPDPDKRRLRNG